MPTASPRACRTPGCPATTTVGDYCLEHQRRRPTRQPDAVRLNSYQRGYSRHWSLARRHWLAAHPLCVICQAEGRTTIATDVDHIQPHRGRAGLFWDESNWQPLCRRCHSRKTATEDSTFARQGPRHDTRQR